MTKSDLLNDIARMPDDMPVYLVLPPDDDTDEPIEASLASVECEIGTAYDGIYLFPRA